MTGILLDARMSEDDGPDGKFMLMSEQFVAIPCLGKEVNLCCQWCFSVVIFTYYSTDVFGLYVCLLY